MWKFQDESLQITLANGLIQGKTDRTDKGSKYRSFKGIPYAAAPIGERRFKGPSVAPSWDGILDATQDADMCVQITNEQYIGSEDCLHLNVYTTQERAGPELPVMVWIHGGAFMTGSSKQQIYGPDYLIEKNVVVVTINYRLGVFGFLSTEDISSPGNYGLKDQIAALRWVQANIQRFGGNPNNVTIFGESAGAASVSYLLLAPQAKGLFHGAISESGTALCPWALQRHPRNIAFEVGIALGIITLSSEDLVNRLRTVDARLLHTASSSAAILNLISPLNGLPYSPTLEPEHDDAVLSLGSHELFRTGEFNRIPYIIGFNSEESSVLLELLDYLRPYLLSYDFVPTNLVPDDLNVPKISLDYIQAGYKIKIKYFGFLSTSLARRTNILKYISDSQFVKPIKETVKLMSKYVPVYFYEFSYEGRVGLRAINTYKPIKSDVRYVEGVGHSEEMWYLWKMANLTADNYYDAKKTDVFTELWTNFAKNGAPTPSSIVDPALGNLSWPASNSGNDFKYMDIGDELNVLDKPRQEAMDFWDDLYETYGVPPFKTY
ncbi:PREDICTED: venom carboxylesterase-6-like [Nicrophorus vespilloides]|uniref:Carboxylic ester hydrolase n=1 Tax=Nicrophorus vespilloides TaxID=110193 RepID=A0ABM1MDB8_NICVS|nr:PREDICTED: venom carboxylesterase-6-like [Nicrophorus vespilloides]